MQSAGQQALQTTGAGQFSNNYIGFLFFLERPVPFFDPQPYLV